MLNKNRFKCNSRESSINELGTIKYANFNFTFKNLLFGYHYMHRSTVSDFRAVFMRFTKRFRLCNI